jgi:hypothetical protein
LSIFVGWEKCRRLKVTSGSQDFVVVAAAVVVVGVVVAGAAPADAVPAVVARVNATRAPSTAPFRVALPHVGCVIGGAPLR